MAHTSFFSPIRKTPYQPLVRAKNNKKHIFEHFELSFFSIGQKIYLEIRSDIKNIILNIIKIYKKQTNNL